MPSMTGIASVLNTMQANEYPPPAFYFTLGFGPTSGMLDASFQEVTGIGSELETEDVVEGGENRYVHRLPKSVKHPKLVLKRGIAEIDSPLVKWCQSVIDLGFGAGIVPKEMTVHLLDENGTPIRSWSFANVYPVNWEVEDFNSTKNEVAIEKIELSYSYSERLI